MKELSSEQQEHTGDDAATRSIPHLVQASLRHGRSRVVSDCLNTHHILQLVDNYVVGITHVRRLEAGHL